MACGYAMYTDRLGVCFATVGPGAFNLVTGLAVAMSDSYPVLRSPAISTTQVGGPRRGQRHVRPERHPGLAGLFAPTTKSRSCSPTSRTPPTCSRKPSTSPSRAARAGAHRGRAEPHPPRRPRGELPRPAARVAAGRSRTPRPSSRSRELAEAIADGRRVLLLAGFGTIPVGAQDSDRTVRRTVPDARVTTLDGKGVIAENHPLCVGVFFESGHSSAWKAFREADVVLAVGNSLNQHATFGLRDDLFEDKTLIQVNITAGEIGKHYRPEHALVSDARPALAAITEALARRSATSRPRRSTARTTKPAHPARHRRTSIRPARPDHGQDAATGWRHPRRRGRPPGLARLLPGARGRPDFRKCGTFGPMAAHTNAAIGVKAAQPHRTVVVGCGDGCYAMAGFELMTAVENDLPVIWVIFNDAEFKLVKVYQLATTARRAGGAPPPTSPPTHERVAPTGYTVDTIEEFSGCTPPRSPPDARP